jgi:protein-S-isoprenylcysteine O-methyltransferase Ste14
MDLPPPDPGAIKRLPDSIWNFSSSTDKGILRYNVTHGNGSRAKRGMFRIKNRGKVPQPPLPVSPICGCGISSAIMHIRNATPLILAFLLLGLICLLSLHRITHQNIWINSIANFDVIFAAVYLVWILIESKISQEELHKGHKTSDYGTCELYALGQAAVFLSALWCTSAWNSPNIFHALGLILFFAGVACRLWAIKTLGKYYSHIVREVAGHRIIASGPYRYIRHPAYAGMILANVGIIIFFFNLVTLTLFLLMLLPAIILRIMIEEKTLFNIDNYADYAKNRSRLFPGIW